MSTARRRRTRGQAFLEFALSLPVLVLLALGASDLGRAFYVDLPAAGMASEGALTGAVSNSADIGVAIRQESGIVPNTATAWGNVYPSGAYSSCSTAPATGTTTQACGDPNGCPTSGVNNAFASASRQGCFAVGMCTMDATNHNGQCSSAITWDSRPLPASSTTSPYTNAALVVRVVVTFKPVTPMVASFFASSGGVLYLSQTELIPEQY